MEHSVQGCTFALVIILEAILKPRGHKGGEECFQKPTSVHKGGHQKKTWSYSYVPNKRVCPFINF